MSRLSLALDTPDLARHYEQASVDRQFKSGKQLIERLGIQPGARVLDVGAGTGLLAAHVADLVGAGGAVTAIDPLPLRIEIAKLKSRANLTFAVGDAYELSGFADGSFDVVYLNAVFHWFPEKEKPLASFFRLLTKGGKLGIATGSREHPSRLHAVQRKVLARAPYDQHVQPEVGLPHRVSAAELGALLKGAGFVVESLEIQPNTTVHPTLEAAVEHSQASSFGNFLGHLPEPLRSQARAEILTELAQYKTSEGYEQEGARLIAVATRA
ncbi:MAG: methyltransferase domain-containing protein [Polyangiales bacterium]